MLDLNELPLDAPDVLVREAFHNTDESTPAIVNVLSRPNVPIDVLVRIGDSLPWHDFQTVAPLLVAHPNFTEEIYNRINEQLRALRWYEDPTECRMAQEALEDAYKNHGLETDNTE